MSSCGSIRRGPKRNDLDSRRSTSVIVSSRSSPRSLSTTVCDARVSVTPAAAAAARVTEYVDTNGYPALEMRLPATLMSQGAR